MAYEDLAAFYDELMGDALYDAWRQALAPHLSSVRVAVDLGCGTGRMAAWLAERAERVYAVDRSPEMLAVAFDTWGHLSNVRWLESDLCDLALPEAADFALASTDVLNYLLTRDELERALQRVRACVRPGGRWALDTLGPRRLQQLRDGAWHDVRNHLVIVHETEVEGETIVHRVCGFVGIEEDGELYRRFDEEHVQRYWDAATLADLFDRTGWEVVEAQGDFGECPVDQADRVVWMLERR
ncbi:class I SAM-dependent DNA methyltransferase [Alicyclobacillus acidocaldarius]|uniref:Methyltransferase type 11 n=1 Tax=Alicyclobacillus acidocaldarius subsp. acidocaldarius (strain ATCC 27009 / DSM 446 / BCRC 14685 / JCM 5260 / KCTC 1825 / NBRC 15652 / NCIMB 11725 / NRRL B-14509 / 104-IA) TaxID=521098 RepID=C8WQ79_ALIAD|nr:class I SAM-dependent methyltransferase [Alicyclobacillus acidocaldarius]ACV59024.1 Methyltransferase type 11 [Alicyclobacillus acidocaldarius subsp. acidocaldarius DSM 446]